MTEGKLMLVACENKTLQGFGLRSREKVGFLNALKQAYHSLIVKIATAKQSSIISVNKYQQKLAMENK